VGFNECHRIALPAAALVQDKGVNQPYQIFVFSYPVGDFNPGDLIADIEVEEVDPVLTVVLFDY